MAAWQLRWFINTLYFRLPSPTPPPSDASLAVLEQHFSFPASIHFCCITFLYTHSFNLSLPRRVKQPDININTTLYLVRNRKFSSNIPSQVSHMTTHGMCSATRRNYSETFLIGSFKQVLVATGFPSIARTTSSFLLLEVRVCIHIPSLLQFLKILVQRCTALRNGWENAAASYCGHSIIAILLSRFLCRLSRSTGETHRDRKRSTLLTCRTAQPQSTNHLPTFVIALHHGLPPVHPSPRREPSSSPVQYDARRHRRGSSESSRRVRLESLLGCPDFRHRRQTRVPCH